MRPFERLPAPDFLARNWERWGAEYATRKAEDPAARFSWSKPGHREMNHQIMPDLKTQTDKHCSYCDFYPSRRGDDTIDHFKPKGDERFYRLAYQWENLYACCWHCQKAKAEQFDEALLRPDDSGYSFGRYFVFNAATGEIQPKPDAPEADKHRADLTIRLLDINHEGQRVARKRMWELHEAQGDRASLDDYAFRFLFE